MPGTLLANTENTETLLRVRLDAEDAGQLDALLDEMAGRIGDGSDEHLAELARDVARKLSPRLRRPLDAMRLWEEPVGLLISGYQVDDDLIGRSPESWRSVHGVLREELLLLLLAAPLGEPYAWSTQQNGRLVHDILPTQGDEHVQLGSSSSTELLWHTEDAFHELRCDYLGLLCLRNDEAVSTTVGIPDLARLSPLTRQALFEPWYHIVPDDSHLSTRNTGDVDSPGLAQRFDDVERRLKDPEPVSVLIGPRDRPYLRIDPAYMTAIPSEARAVAALAEIYALINDSLAEISLAPGDVLLLDNFRAVHGRRPFSARYDGRDRWLKRVSVTRDMRRQRLAAHSATALVV